MWHPYAPAYIPTPTFISSVELSQPEAEVAIGSSYRAARLLVQLHGCAIGYVDIVADPMPKTVDRASIIAALDATEQARVIGHLNADRAARKLPPLDTSLGLQRILELANTPASGCPLLQIGPDAPQVTVGICTRDRAHSLDKTLASLERQSYPNINILVVDNAPSSDATERLVRSRYPQARYVCEPRPGLDHARNRVLVEAQSEIVAFIDDDAIADEQWLHTLTRAFATPDVMGVTGFVAPARMDTAAQELFERFGYSKSFYSLCFNVKTPPPIKIFPYKGYLGTGCNSAFRRSIVEQVGLFDTRLDVGTPVPGAGDLDMFVRILRAGYTLAYEPSAIVFHDHVDSMPALICKMGEYQQASIAYFTKYALIDRDRTSAIIRHIAWSYIRKTVRGFGAVLLKRDRPLALVLSQALNAWLGPIVLYRSSRQAKVHGRVKSG
jgi:glycosyltransferase involved in cell wall biosynthesis